MQDGRVLPKLASLTGALTLVLLALGAVPAGAAPALPEQLSDEFRFSRWAHAATASRVRVYPSTRSRAITRLRFLTEDGRPEVYLALRSRIARDGRTWVKIRVPRRPNGTTGWVRPTALSPLHLVRTHLRVNRRTLRATLFRRGRKVFSARIGVGTGSTPTPRGRFYIRERLSGPALGPIYGPVAFGTSAYSRLSDWPRGGVVGIHGTNQPGLIPGRPSHGCIRMKNGDIRRLARLLPIGTPVRII